MTKKRIFVLEDDPERIIWLHERLYGHECKFVHTSDRHGEFEPPYDLILLDHDIGNGPTKWGPDSGVVFVKRLEDRLPEGARVIVHSWNKDGAERMVRLLQEMGAAVDWFPYRGRDFDRALDALVGERRERSEMLGT